MCSGVQRPHPLTPVPQNRNSEPGATGTKVTGPTRCAPGDGQCASAAEVAATLRDGEDERDRQKELTAMKTTSIVQLFPRNTIYFAVVTLKFNGDTVSPIFS